MRNLETTRAGARILRRWSRLVLGLGVFGAGIALMVRSDLGLSSWDVLHDAVPGLSPLTFGQAVIAVSVAVLLVSLAFGVRPGPGTVANVLLVGVFADAFLARLVPPGLGTAPLAVRVAALLAGIGAIAFGTALYIGARLGAGPRDGLMLAVSTRCGISPGAARTGIELSVLALGSALGGAAGVGTLVFAASIGPAIDLSFRSLGMETGPRHPSGSKVGERPARGRRRGRPETSSCSDTPSYCAGRLG